MRVGLYEAMEWWNRYTNLTGGLTRKIRDEKQSCYKLRLRGSYYVLEKN